MPAWERNAFASARKRKKESLWSLPDKRQGEGTEQRRAEDGGHPKKRRVVSGKRGQKKEGSGAEASILGVRKIRKRRGREDLNLRAKKVKVTRDRKAA